MQDRAIKRTMRKANLPDSIQLFTTKETVRYEKMTRLAAELNAQFKESATLEKAIKKNLRGLGYDF